ncbi:hypothetical protein FHS91_003546 [Sphingobium xanthum]
MRPLRLRERRSRQQSSGRCCGDASPPRLAVSSDAGWQTGTPSGKLDQIFFRQNHASSGDILFQMSDRSSSRDRDHDRRQRQ